MGRAPCCDKERVKKGTWSAEEDAILKAYADKHPAVTNWIALPKKIGLNRCGKSCRLRWLNYLRPDIKHGKFSEEEDRIISKYYFTIGSRWSKIAEKLPGRTDNDIKNYWNTKLKKDYGGNKRKSRPRHSFTGCIKASTSTPPHALLFDDDDDDNEVIINSIDNPGVRRSLRRNNNNNVFTITHGDVMSTSWPSTSQLLDPPPLNNQLVDDPFYMLTTAVDVSPSNALKELENLLFDEDEDEDRPMMEGHTRDRNVVVSSWDDVVEMAGGGPGGDRGDVDITNTASLNCFPPAHIDPNYLINNNSNSNCDDEFLPQDILHEFSYTKY